MRLRRAFGARVPVFWGEGFVFWGEGSLVLGRGFLGFGARVSCFGARVPVFWGAGSCVLGRGFLCFGARVPVAFVARHREARRVEIGGRLLRRWWQHSTIARVCHQVGRIWKKWLSRRNRQGVVPWSRLNGNAVLCRSPTDTPPRANPSREETECRNFRTFGSVRDGDGNVPIYSAMTWICSSNSSSIHDGEAQGADVVNSPSRPENPSRSK